MAPIGKLYAVEPQIRGMRPKHRHAVRLEKSQPILEKVKAWLDDKAIQYTRKQWPTLVTCQKDGHLKPTIAWPTMRSGRLP